MRVTDHKTSSINPAKANTDKGKMTMHLVIEKLKASKLSKESDAYADGKLQAQMVMTHEPNYRLLAELSDIGKAFEAEKPVDTNYISGLDDYPSALRYYLIKGFYDTISGIEGLMTPCSDGGDCNKSCTRCEDGIHIQAEVS